MLTAAAEKSFFETLKGEVDKVELFYLELLDDLRTDFQSLILQSYRLVSNTKRIGFLFLFYFFELNKNSLRSTATTFIRSTNIS